jgi:cell division inhibitor SepF
MGAWRKAGVWLGLVEDEDRRYVEDELDGFDDEYDEPAPRGRLDRSADRLADREQVDDRYDRTDHGPVRTFGRTPAGVPATASAGAGSRVGMVQDNLALAPQVALRERAMMAEEESAYRITTLHPTTYNEARTIGEHFRRGVPVIMNLTEMSESDAKRLVDFSAGLAFGLRGSIERVTNRVFLLSPANVSVTAEDKARIAEGGFFNQS